MSNTDIIDAKELVDLATGILVESGLAPPAAAYVAETLVEADLEGISSHGVMLLPMYVERIRAGSVSVETSGEVVKDEGAIAVIDARNILGQLTAIQAVQIATEKAKEFGLGAVAVRHGFHFGTAGQFALKLADAGCVGIVMCTTRPLLPAPGGAEALVGNNPLAIAMPTKGDGPPVLLDMATSASAMGKIRMAEANGQKIPSEWATDAEGKPTTDPTEAIKGMLLPAAGPKGFGLAFMIDLLCGGLSSGATGSDIMPLYGDKSVPYDCGHFFMAIDVSHFRDETEFRKTSASARDRIRSSKTAPGIDTVMSPGEPAWNVRKLNGDQCPIDRSVLNQLRALSQLSNPIAATND